MKKKILLIAIMIGGYLPMSIAQCNYDQTLIISNPALLQTGNMFNFTAVPTNTAGDATVTVSVYGDIDGQGGNLEEWTIFDENSLLLGTVGATGNFGDQCGSTIVASFTIPQATLDTWTVDGTISFMASDVVGNISVTLCGNEFVQINLTYPLAAGSIPPVPDVATLVDFTNECSATPTAPTATDGCGITVTGTTTTSFPITVMGTTTITWTYDDGNGNVATQNQDVIVNDLTAPIADVASLPDTTGCTITVVAPTATDNCVGAITGTTTDQLTYDTDGTYIVTWTFDDGNGNTSTQTQNVIIVNPLTISATIGDEITGGDGSIDLTTSGGAPVITFDWDNDGTGDNDDTEDLSGLIAGVYTVIVTDGNGCTATGSYTVISQVGIEENNTSFSIYPNPTSGLVLISLNAFSNNTQLTITNSIGQVIYSNIVTEIKFEIDLSEFSDGIYFIEITNNQFRTIQKIVKK